MLRSLQYQKGIHRFNVSSTVQDTSPRSLFSAGTRSSRYLAIVHVRIHLCRVVEIESSDGFDQRIQVTRGFRNGEGHRVVDACLREIVDSTRSMESTNVGIYFAVANDIRAGCPR